MTARSTILMLAASLALAPALLAQDHAVPAAAAAAAPRAAVAAATRPPACPRAAAARAPATAVARARAPAPHAPSTAERRHPRAGTGRGSGGGYYRGYPGYSGYSGYYPGWGGGWYYPGYAWGSWWPYGSFGWYGGYYGYPWGWGGGGGGVYHYVQRESGSLRVLVDPSEARVYVDGYYAGTVDDFDGLFQRLHVSPGRHEIALKLEGYKTHRIKVYVAPDTTPSCTTTWRRARARPSRTSRGTCPRAIASRARGGGPLVGERGAPRAQRSGRLAGASA